MTVRLDGVEKIVIGHVHSTSMGRVAIIVAIARMMLSVPQLMDLVFVLQGIEVPTAVKCVQRILLVKTAPFLVTAKMVQHALQKMVNVIALQDGKVNSVIDPVMTNTTEKIVHRIATV